MPGPGRRAWSWATCLVLTDVVNDDYRRAGARFITLVAAAMAALAWAALVGTSALPTDPDSDLLDGEYRKIFGGSAKLCIASILAFLVGQFLDISIFQFWKRLTRARHLWLRATGSTLISQLVDTAIINAIFWGGVADRTPAWIGAKTGRECRARVPGASAGRKGRARRPGASTGREYRARVRHQDGGRRRADPEGSTGFTRRPSAWLGLAPEKHEVASLRVR